MCSYRHEHRGEPVRHGACLKLACLPENDTLPQAASGGARGAGARRKSSAAGMEGVWAFHHLRRALLACCGAPAARGRRCDLTMNSTLALLQNLRPSHSIGSYQKKNLIVVVSNRIQDTVEQTLLSAPRVWS